MISVAFQCLVKMLIYLRDIIYLAHFFVLLIYIANNNLYLHIKIFLCLIQTIKKL